MIGIAFRRALGLLILLGLGSAPARAHESGRAHTSVQMQARLAPPFVMVSVWVETPTRFERQLYIDRVGPLEEATSQKLVDFRLDREREIMESLDLRAERRPVYEAFRPAPMPSELQQRPGQTLYLVNAKLDVGQTLVDGRFTLELGWTLEGDAELWYSAEASGESGWTVLEDSFSDLVQHAEGLERRGDEIWTADPQARHVRWVFTDR